MPVNEGDVLPIICKKFSRIELVLDRLLGGMQISILSRLNEALWTGSDAYNYEVHFG